jgi:hypothetical protein
MAARLCAAVRHRKKRAFLASFERWANISAACRVAGVDRMTYRYWMEHDEAFALAVGIAAETATELLEEEAQRRAVEGAERPVFFQGARVGSIVECSDILLMFLLKARAPHKYRDNAPPAASDGPAVKVVADIDMDAI